MTRPLRIALFAFLVVAACSKKDAGSEPEPAASSSGLQAPPSSSAPQGSNAGAVSDAGGAPSASASGVASASSSASASASASSLALNAAAAVSVATLPDGGPACGVKPLPDCPMQGWMKRNTSAAMAAGDMPAVAFAFDQMIPFAPPGYTNWASISKDGAAAARMGNESAAKAACRGCHDQYRTKYRTELRARPVP